MDSGMAKIALGAASLHIQPQLAARRTPRFFVCFNRS
jgi:hypothetical protein